MLSGTAADGTLGLGAIKELNGITFAQDSSAKYESMPLSAVASGCVDFVLAPEQIAEELTHIARHPSIAENYATSNKVRQRATVRTKAAQDALVSNEPDAPGSHGVRSEGLVQVLRALRNFSGVDFWHYKPATIERRVNRRMVLSRIETLGGYAASLANNPTELQRLYLDLLISVTDFFRNPEVFNRLTRDIFALSLEGTSDGVLRAWVPGCSTGQEAYSLAMAFMECPQHATRACSLKVFATDLNDAVLNVGRAGFYSKSLVQAVSPERLRRFFVEEPLGYRVSKGLREMVVFAQHNLLRDPPFSRMDMVSCRNLLIYLEPGIQKQVLRGFHYALKPEGHLVLGLSESINALTDLFVSVDHKRKIYRKRVTALSMFHVPTEPSGILHQLATPNAPAPTDSVERPLEVSPEREADRIIVKRFAPVGVLINAQLRIVQFRGLTSPYLMPPAHKAEFDLLAMAREGLGPVLRAVIGKVKSKNTTVRKEGILVEEDNGHSRRVDVEVIPLKNIKEPHYLVLFQENQDAEHTRTGVRRGAEARGRDNPPSRLSKRKRMDRISLLELQLAEARDYVQALQEHDQSVSEQAQATTEEVQSANEELQSINEEMESSKEELESTNEELITVNEEMTSRNTELSRLNADLTNLHHSINLPIVVLGDDLIIRHFTPPAERLFNLMPGDVGRPLGRVKHHLKCADLETFIVNAIEEVSVREREVQDISGVWYMLRVRPYVTADKHIQGAVLVLVDIDALKHKEQQVQRARDYAEGILRTARDPLVVLRADLRINTANEAFYQAFGLTRTDAEGRSIFEINAGAWSAPKLRGLLEDILPRNSFFDDFEVIHEFPGIGRRMLLLSARPLDYEDGQPQLILLSIEDVTERLESLDVLRTSESRFRRLFDTSQEGILVVDPVSRTIIDANPRVVELLDRPYDALRGKELWEVGVLRDEASSHAVFRELQEKNTVHFKAICDYKTGKSCEIDVVGTIYLENGCEVIQYNIHEVGKS